MKVKIYVIFLMLFSFSILHLSKIYAVDSTLQNLPDGAKYRIGQGKFSQIKFFPDGSRIAATSNIGILIYNAYTGGST